MARWNNLKRSKKAIVFAVIIPSIIIFLVTFLLRYTFPLELFPNNDTYFEYTAFTNDNSDSAKTKASVDTSGGHLHFSYTLSSDSDEPFAMLLFHAHELARTIDLEKYKFIDIDIEPEMSNDFNFTLYMYVPYFSSPEYVETHRPYTMKCRVNDSKHYHYPIKELATPTKWFTTYATNEEVIPKTDWEKLTHISISDFGEGPFNETQHVFVKRLRFTDCLLEELIIATGVMLVYIVLSYLFIYYYKRYKTRKIKQRIYYSNSSKNYSDEQAKKLVNFLTENFKDPLLSHSKVKEAVNINSIQTNDILVDRFNLKYKEYINTLRITEAKKILIESDCQINAISAQVGFCYPNSFSRAFKQIEGITPNKFRKKQV